MISPQALIQLKAFARQDGLILALIWLSSMLFTIKVPESIIGPLLALSTPFFVSWRLSMFRDGALDGHISLRRSIAFTCYVFFYASLIFAIGQYLYFMFFDNGDFINLLSTAIDTMKAANISLGTGEEDMEMTMKGIQMMSPINLVFVFMMNNLVIGAMLSPVISILSKMTEKRKV